MAKPPPTTDQILQEILNTVRLLLKEVTEGMAVAVESLNVEKKQLHNLHQIQESSAKNLDIAAKQLDIANQALEAEQQQLAVARQTLKAAQQQLDVATQSQDILSQILETIQQPPEQHTYTLEVSKEKPLMPVQPGIAANFNVTMSDNGNPITPPAGTVYAWFTDDSTDVIVDLSSDGSASRVSVQTTDPPAAGRTMISITASAADPKGDVIQDTLTTDILPGVTHTFTLTVSQDFASTQPPMIPLPKPGGGKLPNKGGGKK